MCPVIAIPSSPVCRRCLSHHDVVESVDGDALAFLRGRSRRRVRMNGVGDVGGERIGVGLGIESVNLHERGCPVLADNPVGRLPMMTICLPFWSRRRTRPSLGGRRRSTNDRESSHTSIWLTFSQSFGPSRGTFDAKTFGCSRRSDGFRG